MGGELIAESLLDGGLGVKRLARGGAENAGPSPWRPWRGILDVLQGLSEVENWHAHGGRVRGRVRVWSGECGVFEGVDLGPLLRLWITL